MHRVKGNLREGLGCFHSRSLRKKISPIDVLWALLGGIALLVTQTLRIPGDLCGSLAALVFPRWERMITRSKCLVVGPLAHAYNIRKASMYRRGESPSSFTVSALGASDMVGWRTCACWSVCIIYFYPAALADSSEFFHTLIRPTSIPNCCGSYWGNPISCYPTLLLERNDVSKCNSRCWAADTRQITASERPTNTYVDVDICRERLQEAQ